MKLLLCLLFLADIWIEAPAGYYVLSINSQGVPIITPAPSVTDIIHMGQAPVPVPVPPDNDKDTWGLIEISETEALKINDPLTGTKLNIAYTETGKKVKEGAIPENLLGRALDEIFKAATGNKEQLWIPWKDSVHGKYNTSDFENAEESGQGLIDIGTGVGLTSNQANGEWLKLFIEVILPLILKLLGL